MIEDLEREGLIRKIPVDRKRVADLLALARRDVATPRTLGAGSHDWAYTIAYNAVLQAGRALMAAHGYRPDGPNQHISVVKFAALYLGETDAVIFRPDAAQAAHFRVRCSGGGIRGCCKICRGEG